MILLIDNYDSFTFNLVQQIKAQIAYDLQVFRNDAITLAQAIALAPSALVFSPGPGGPSHTGVCRELLTHFTGKIPILGVCLGHQLIAQHLGARVLKSKSPRHGKTSLISHQSRNLFAGIPSPFSVMRYHSLLVDRIVPNFPMEVDAYSDDGVIMALSDRSQMLFGVQFHPESFLSEHGDTIIRNFLSFVEHDRCS